jgi:hypothetical protein
MTAPLPLKVGDRVKMVHNDYPTSFPDDLTPLGCNGVVLDAHTENLVMTQPYAVVFEGFKRNWKPGTRPLR